MPKLSPIKAKELIVILLKLGFSLKRQKGSHAFFEDASGNTTIIPIHPREEISPGLLRKIIGDIKLTHEGFNDLRQEKASMRRGRG